jgi:hypothetical protein
VKRIDWSCSCVQVSHLVRQIEQQALIK